MHIKDKKLAARLEGLLPGVRQFNHSYHFNDIWRLAARATIFLKLNAIEECIYESDMEIREMAVTRAVLDIGALLMYLELSHQFMTELALGGMQHAMHSGPEMSQRDCSIALRKLEATA
jgi:hypothetical protein